MNVNLVHTEEIKVADEAWIALALLHRRHPERESFTAREILDEARREKAHPDQRSGLQAHIYMHNVANVRPNSAKYRMFYKVPSGGYRLFRTGDDSHPDREGKIAPSLAELPAHYHHLLSWYEKEYSRRTIASNDEDDPVLQMWGVGKDIWADEDGDTFVARERAEMDREMDRRESEIERQRPVESLSERIWNRIVAHQGDQFRTTTDLPFTHLVEGNGIWFYREGERVNQRLSRGDVQKAIQLCPVSKTTEFSKLRDPSYLFGLLMDPRIRGTDW